MNPAPVNARALLPIVLAGGKSSRFGRNKLFEPCPSGEPLIARPIAALRDAFGPRVLLAGATDPSLLALGDGVIPDDVPDLGPIGAIASALRRAATAGLTGIFVLAGDMPAFGASGVRMILTTADHSPDALAVLGCEVTVSAEPLDPSRILPCTGIYRSAALPLLKSAIARGHLRLRDVLPLVRICLVPVSPRAAHNVNRPQDLAASPGPALE